MKPLKQNSGDKNCVAVVAAMAFGKPITDFKEVVGGKPPYSEHDFVKYALDQDAFAVGIDKVSLPKVIDESTVISFSIPIGKMPAMVIVKSENPSDKLIHSLYYDGKQLYDPNPQSKNGRPISDYKVISWYPIIRSEDHE